MTRVPETCLLAGLLWLGLSPAAWAQAALPSPGPTPTPLERLLQAEYLDQHFVLRADVKRKQVTSHRVLRSTVASSPGLQTSRPITVVTREGVFYRSDYARKERLASDVHMGLGSPGRLPSGDPQGGLVQTADVVEISSEPQVEIHAGELARITGVAEIPGSIQVTLESSSGQLVQVLVRSGKEAHRPALQRADGFTAALGQLLFLIPEDPSRWIQSGWPEALLRAIRDDQVVLGMNQEQVLLSWGTPLYITGDEEVGTHVWTYQRGTTLRQRLRNRTRVYFVGDAVVEVEADR